MRGDLKGVGHLEMEQKDEFKHTHRMMEREADRAQSGGGEGGVVIFIVRSPLYLENLK